MISCPSSAIAFSQVREDPCIELRVAERLAERQDHLLRVLLVASGGCTALSLLAAPVVGKVEAVDANFAQIHLVELRRQALLHLALIDQIQLIGADRTTSEKQRLALYKRLRPYLPEPTRSFWDTRLEQIAFGVNRVGRFEALFRELSANFSALGLDPLHDPKTAIAHPAWSEIFESVFDRDKLTRIFGEAAVSYSMDRSFGKHFAERFAIALQRDTPCENYFVSQVFADCYADNIQGFPLYLQPLVQASIRALNGYRLKLHHGNFVEKMLELSQSGGFDLISMSNLSDWMPIPDLHEAIAKAVGCLNPGGALIGRRLNGDHHLKNVISQHLHVDERFSAELLAADRSFFYQEVVVGFAE